MKGYRFYEEFTNKRKGISAGNVVALLLNERGRPLYHGRDMVDAIAGVSETPNSGVASVSVSREYLAKHCKRVTEKRAREVHPRLFTDWLDRTA